ncbi:hypothetical protein OVX45_27570, partial [Klebsiella pneumoniae]|uniref:hypothetical protein n=1 Tax=Klebsiella pneumoniae TaxID=573 RepID=UPI002270903D
KPCPVRQERGGGETLVDSPATMHQAERTYPTAGVAVLKVYMEGGKVKFVRPDDLRLADARKQ